MCVLTAFTAEMIFSKPSIVNWTAMWKKRAKSVKHSEQKDNFRCSKQPKLK